MKNALMCLDPSINNLGCAIFGGADGKKLLAADLLHPDKKYRNGDYFDKSYSLFRVLDGIVTEYYVSQIVMEIPEHWSHGGFIARESGSIFKVSFVCGVVYSLRAREQIKTFKLITPRGWKKQLPKDVVRNRLKPYYVSHGYYTDEEWMNLDHNILDAVGIGHWRLFGRV